MTKQNTFLRTAQWSAAILSLWAFIVPSCSRSNEIPAFCRDPGTLREMYFGFDDSNAAPGEAQCFGPSGDCSELCTYLADSEATGEMIAWAEVCERVPSPDGWADAGYRGWEDAGYVAMTTGDGGVDPSRILHVVFRIKRSCGV